MTTTAAHDAADSTPRTSAESELDLEQAVPMFLEYMRSYRSCAPLSVQAYRANLRVRVKWAWDTGLGAQTSGITS
jgi:hypothetical protein